MHLPHMLKLFRWANIHINLLCLIDSVCKLKTVWSFASAFLTFGFECHVMSSGSLFSISFVCLVAFFPLCGPCDVFASLLCIITFIIHIEMHLVFNAHLGVAVLVCVYTCEYNYSICRKAENARKFACLPTSQRPYADFSGGATIIVAMVN